MDEAERCHRLAFIFRGTLLDVGTPEEIVERRDLRVAEFEIDRPREVAELLRQRPEVDELSHFGHLLRVAVRGPSDPLALVREVSQSAGAVLGAARPTRVTVEDAFVSMVRRDQAMQSKDAA
jgi:ABC-2 type transport system ATP-binding protein